MTKLICTYLAYGKHRREMALYLSILFAAEGM